MPRKPYTCPFCQAEHAVVFDEVHYSVTGCALGDHRVDLKFLYSWPTHPKTTMSWVFRYRNTLEAMIRHGNETGKPYVIRWQDIEWGVEPQSR